MRGGGTMMDARAAVVVATYARPQHLDRLLTALEAQEGAPPFEVVVVDDASPGDVADVVARHADGVAAVPIRYLRQPENRGPATARNRGWRATDAVIVAFTDDDCVPAPGWLAALAREVDAGADLVQGRDRAGALAARTGGGRSA